ncbi:MAG: TolC family protein, partial [Cyclobacteriaceae bacterium]
MKRFWILLLFLGGLNPHLFSQTVNPDSTSILKFDDFYSLVLSYHPVVRQAELLADEAQQQIRFARGAFDPKFQGTWNRKHFNEKEYYNLLDVSVKIPVWFPVNPEVGVMRNAGEYLNPENFIADDTRHRQFYAGVSIPVGRGLFIDQRRATVRQALIFQEMAEAEQIKQVNKILLQAAKDYWDWYFAYNNYLLMEQNIAIAQDIFDRTKLAFEFGEAAVIDTVQAKITLLN